MGQPSVTSQRDFLNVIKVNGSLFLFLGASLAADCCRKTLEASVLHNSGAFEPGRCSLQITTNAAALPLPKNHGPVTQGVLWRKCFFFLFNGLHESSREKDPVPTTRCV